MKKNEYPIHPDFKMWSRMRPPINRFMLPVMQRLMELLWLRERTTAELRVTRESIRSADGSEIRALLYSPVGIGENAPCLVVYHGGGFVLPAAPYHFSLAREYALSARCKVLFVDYRLAPKHPFPATPEDCFAAYRWALDNAERLSINPSKIAVSGDSAGAQLAIVVCLMAKERGRAIPCAQMLMYPAVGSLPETKSYREFTDTPMCSSKDMEKYSRFYLQDKSAGKPEYSSPIHAPSLADLPPAYIETAEFDPLRDGGILYAKRLRDEGVSALLTNTKGTMHGFDIVFKSPIVRKCVSERVAFLRGAFEE
ncbi:MAG: alpha/beta hydrolase [Eubacteriales bacterium]|nr:alpha/beta hydrolase [Eubacteriales bacterium]